MIWIHPIIINNDIFNKCYYYDLLCDLIKTS